MFENLQDKLDRAFKVLKGQGSITEKNVAETMKEIRKALLDADVNYKTAKAFTDDLKEKAHEVMQLLNDAYSKKDIDKVKAILFDLENGIAFKTESNCINDIELLKAKILEYQEKITKIELEIFNIKIDETNKDFFENSTIFETIFPTFNSKNQ